MNKLRRYIVGVAAIGLFAGGVGLPAQAVSGADAVAQCRAATVNLPVADVGPRTCRSIEQLVWGTAAWCRYPLRSTGDPSAAEACAAVDGRVVSDARVAAYQNSGVHAALALQRDLTSTAPLWDEQITHTHNSFNSSAYRLTTDGAAPSYYPTLTNMDPNQVLSLSDQLDLDVRFLELDLHWVPSPYGTAATGGKWVTLCHGNSSIVAGIHVGCTADRPFEDGLAEIKAWLDAHPGEFVFLYLENQLSGDPMAHELAGQLLADAFPGSQVFAPPSNQPCAPMPLDRSRDEMRAAGARVLIVGNCDATNGAATAWGTLVHERGPRWTEDGDPTHYSAADCAADRAARQAHTDFRRWFGDSTWLTAMTAHGTNPDAATVATLVACGANIVGLDQLTADDDRLAAQVWSWSPAEALNPSGSCVAQQGTDGAAPGRFAGAPCADHHPFACSTPDRQWHVTTASGAWSDGSATCAAEFAGSTFGVPVNGLQNVLVTEARPTADGEVWLNLTRAG
jgi:hypothetical protein